MTLETQISLLTTPQDFARLCNALLRAEHGDDFLAIDDDQPDAGNDGYLKSERRMFAMHCFKRAQNQRIEQLIRRKMVGDLGKAIALKDAGVWEIDRWTFVSNYPIAERIAAEVVKIGEAAGIDVSWMGPAELATAVQRHPVVRELFPALQINEVAQRLGELHESVEGLARGLEPDAAEGVKIPRTAEEQARLIATRPSCWEYRLFAGALVQAQDALEFAYLDYVMRIARGSEPVDFATAIDTIEAVYREVSNTVDPLERVFSQEAQERAFGRPGEPGDVRAILHLASNVTAIYADLLSGARRLLSIEPPQVLRGMRELVLRQLDRPIELMRAFVANAVAEIEKLDEYLATEEPVVITLDLTLELDPEIGRQLEQEMRRVRRKLRWRGFTGLDIDSH